MFNKTKDYESESHYLQSIRGNPDIDHFFLLYLYFAGSNHLIILCALTQGIPEYKISGVAHLQSVDLNTFSDAEIAEIRKKLRNIIDDILPDAI